MGNLLQFYSIYIFYIDKRRDKNPDFYDGAKSVLQTLQTICLHYENELRAEKTLCKDDQRSDILAQMADNLHHIAYLKPETFWQAA